MDTPESKTEREVTHIKSVKTNARIKWIVL
jgi:hypothetical protein